MTLVHLWKNELDFLLEVLGREHLRLLTEGDETQTLCLKIVEKFQLHQKIEEFTKN